MSIQQRRMDRGWAQEELALHTGLSVRTIQRIEAGKRASLESLKCLAAVFETSVSELVQEQDMIEKAQTRTPFDTEVEKDAIAFVQNVKAFHMNWISYAFIIPMLAVLNYFLSPQFWWSAIVAVIWGFAIVMHVVVINQLFGSEWEQREFLKRINHRR